MKLDKVREVGRHRTDLGNIRQFASLATTLSALADATQPKLRSIR